MTDRESDEYSQHDDSEAHNISHLPVAYELEIHRIIQCEAFILAEKDGFKQCPLNYWLAAEKLVRQQV